MFVRCLIFLLFPLFMTAAPAFAQQPADPNANIVYPLSVDALSGTFNIVGTANLPGMTSYFLEFRPLIDPLTSADASVPWQPATLPSPVPVIVGLLGTWNTTVTPDGLYELRLTIFTGANQAIYARVSPLRVINNLPPFAITPISVSLPPPSVIIVTATPSDLQIVQPPVQPANGSPQVTAAIDANVRAGDGVGYAPVGALLNGQSAPIIGVSSTGSGWWLIILPNGRQGWIAGSTVRLTGNVSSVPQVAPPPPPATPTPIASATPVASAVPTNLPDASIVKLHLDDAQDQGDFLYLGHPYHIFVTVANNSPFALPAVTLACNFSPINSFFSANLAGLPPFAQSEVAIPFQLDTGANQTVTAQCAVDVNNLVAETDESNNFASLSHWLES